MVHRADDGRDRMEPSKVCVHGDIADYGGADSAGRSSGVFKVDDEESSGISLRSENYANRDSQNEPQASVPMHPRTGDHRGKRNGTQDYYSCSLFSSASAAVKRDNRRHRDSGDHAGGLSKLYAPGADPYLSGGAGIFGGGDSVPGERSAVENCCGSGGLGGNPRLGGEGGEEKLYSMYQLRQVQLVEKKGILWGLEERW